MKHTYIVDDVIYKKMINGLNINICFAYTEAFYDYRIDDVITFVNNKMYINKYVKSITVAKNYVELQNHLESEFMKHFIDPSSVEHMNNKNMEFIAIKLSHSL
jgi:hypothetical protein